MTKRHADAVPEEGPSSPVIKEAGGAQLRSTREIEIDIRGRAPARPSCCSRLDKRTSDGAPGQGSASWCDLRADLRSRGDQGEGWHHGGPRAGSLSDVGDISDLPEVGAPMVATLVRPGGTIRYQVKAVSELFSAGFGHRWKSTPR